MIESFTSASLEVGILSEWRAAGEGRIVQVGQHGVTLCPGVGAEPPRFKDADAALEYLTRP